MSNNFLSSQLDVNGHSVQDIIEARRLVEEFEKNDAYHSTFPAWVFLIDNVVKTYGNCPYLPYDKAHLRHEHIKTNPSIYEDALARYVHKSIYSGLESEHQTAKENLEQVVYEEISNVYVGKDPKKFIDVTLSEARWFQNQRSRTKVVTERWQRTLKDIDTIHEKTGVNLALFLKAFYDITIKYKAGVPNTKANTTSAVDTFETAYERFTRSLTARETEETHISHVREDAIQRLVKLIRNGFKEAQTGKYKKRWNLLTDTQQLERIQSFSNYYCLLNNDTENQTNDLVSAIMDRIVNKKLKTSDIKWVIKEGIIKEIQTLSWKDGKFCFEDTKNKTKVKKVATVIKPSSVSTKPQLSETDIERLHRLTVHCMTLPCVQSRDILIDRVVTLFTRHFVIRDVARDYVAGVLDNIIALTSTIEA